MAVLDFIAPRVRESGGGGEPTDALGEDVRFKNHGLAPKSAADFAFLLHGFHYLKDEGVMAIMLPHGVLFRGGAEERIRTKLLKDGHIDTAGGGRQKSQKAQKRESGFCVF